MRMRVSHNLLPRVTTQYNEVTTESNGPILSAAVMHFRAINDSKAFIDLCMYSNHSL
jgi:hypothetical protein